MTVPYASLLNAKIIEPTTNGSLVIDQHFFIFCMQPILAKIKVDDEWYLTRYPDVRLAIDNHVVPNVAAHYTRHGYFENRMPYRIEVDPEWYLQSTRLPRGHRCHSSALTSFGGARYGDPNSKPPPGFCAP